MSEDILLALVAIVCWAMGLSLGWMKWGRRQ